MNLDNEVEQLEKIIQDLHIESKRIANKQREVQQDLQSLKQQLHSRKIQRANRRGEEVDRDMERPVLEGYNAIGGEYVKDRNSNVLHVSAKVYICTKGAYSSNRGVIKTIARAPKLCTILDLEGVTQSRLSKIVVIENKDTLKYLN